MSARGASITLLKTNVGIKISHYNKICTAIIISLCCSFPSLGYSYELYTGIIAGFGSTNWSRISTSDPDLQSTLPAQVKDNNTVIGTYLGIVLNSYLNIELRYEHYSSSTISFAQFNEYAPPPFNPFSMKSDTNNWALLSKLKISIAKKWQLNPIFGAGYTTRNDILASQSSIAGIFGLGFSYQLFTHTMCSISFNYMTGKATINLTPAKSYVPFLTQVTYNLEYYF